jgi:hypothetical protein
MSSGCSCSRWPSANVTYTPRLVTRRTLPTGPSALPNMPTNLTPLPANLALKSSAVVLSIWMRRSTSTTRNWPK